MNIYQIQQNLLAIFDELEENGGELTEELEQELALTQQDFKEKCKSYADVIKMTKADIAAIDEETKRLAALKKTKNNLIERLSKIMIEAIEMFGDTTNKGGKFVDYGTGKLSIRNSKKVEVNDDKAEAITDEFGKIMYIESMLAGASTRESITYEDIIKHCESHMIIEDDGDVLSPQDVTKDDIENTTVEISFKEKLKNLMSGDGYDALKNLLVFHQGVFFTPKVDKTTLKLNLSGDNNISMAKIVENKSLTIK